MRSCQDLEVDIDRLDVDAGAEGIGALAQKNAIADWKSVSNALCSLDVSEANVPSKLKLPGDQSVPGASTV